jgi:hypothetical protein
MPVSCSRIAKVLPILGKSSSWDLTSICDDIIIEAGVTIRFITYKSKKVNYGIRCD